MIGTRVKHTTEQQIMDFSKPDIIFMKNDLTFLHKIKKKIKPKN